MDITHNGGLSLFLLSTVTLIDLWDSTSKLRSHHDCLNPRVICAFSTVIQHGPINFFWMIKFSSTDVLVPKMCTNVYPCKSDGNGGNSAEYLTSKNLLLPFLSGSSKAYSLSTTLDLKFLIHLNEWVNFSSISSRTSEQSDVWSRGSTYMIHSSPLTCIHELTSLPVLSLTFPYTNTLPSWSYVASYQNISSLPSLLSSTSASDLTSFLPPMFMLVA